MEGSLISNIPSCSSGPSPSCGDKGKAPLVEEDEDEEEDPPLQIKRRASALPTLDDDPELAPGEGIILFWAVFILCLESSSFCVKTRTFVSSGAGDKRARMGSFPREEEMPEMSSSVCLTFSDSGCLIVVPRERRGLEPSYCGLTVPTNSPEGKDH